MSLNDEDSNAHFEVLLRIREENGLLVSPSNCIAAAERFGLMPEIDRWVMDAAFARLRNIIAAPESPIGTYAINLSGAGMGQPGFVDFVQDRFIAYDIPPTMICFELTETAAIANLDVATKFIATFKDQGCRFALDEVGVGMSSLSYLKRLQVDYLKIDGSFVKNMLSAPWIGRWSKP